MGAVPARQLKILLWGGGGEVGGRCLLLESLIIHCTELLFGWKGLHCSGKKQCRVRGLPTKQPHNGLYSNSCGPRFKENRFLIIFERNFTLFFSILLSGRGFLCKILKKKRKNLHLTISPQKFIF